MINTIVAPSGFGSDGCVSGGDGVVKSVHCNCKISVLGANSACRIAGASVVASVPFKLKSGASAVLFYSVCTVVSGWLAAMIDTPVALLHSLSVWETLDT